MKKVFFGIFLWLLGIVGDDVVEDRISSRGKCREIVVENKEVRIKFLNKEDAEIFAKDLKELIDNR